MADALMFIANIIFVLALLPTVIHQATMRASTIALTTSGTTMLGLLLIIVAAASLGLWWTVVATSLSWLLWGITAIQRLRYWEAMNDAR